mmetsp:Transcript_24248/g.50677  ORF Transcript_24248/g.50677 Transcript_24248/m.50677 type:complete len:135 (+) Transcript_24248:166-570(+)
MTWTKLHDLCGSRTDPINTQEIIRRARTVSEEVIHVDDRGYTPLHIAVVSRDPSVEVIDALLKANPNAVMEKVLLSTIQLCAYWLQFQLPVIMIHRFPSKYYHYSLTFSFCIGFARRHAIASCITSRYKSESDS